MIATVPICKGKYDVEVMRPFCKALKKAGLIYNYSIRGIVTEDGKQYGTIWWDRADGITMQAIQAFKVEYERIA